MRLLKASHARQTDRDKKEKRYVVYNALFNVAEHVQFCTGKYA